MLTQNQTLQNGRYTIIDVSEKTKYGMNYEAFDNELRRNILLKEILDTGSATEDASRVELGSSDFSKTAEMLTGVKHASLFQIKNYFSEANFHYLVTDIIDGKNLAVLFEQKQNPFTPNDIIRWADQLLNAVSLLHSQSPPIIHNDIRPENIYLTSAGNIKLSTLNIIQNANLKKYSISEDEIFDSRNLTFSSLEQFWFGLDSASQNVILNNFDEQSQKILENPTDARSDIYSLGATLYYLLTAEMPFDSLSRLIDVLDGNDDPLMSPNEINSRIPKEISMVIMKAMEIKRENRFNSVSIMKQVMRTALIRAKEEAAKSVNKTKPEKVSAINTEKQVVQKAKQPVKQVGGEVKSQLELIKKQLREAEERRLIAEKRASEAERLLQQQANLNAVQEVERIAPIAETDNQLQEVVLEIIPPEEINEPVAENQVNPAAISQISVSDTLGEQDNSNAEESEDHFDDLYQNPEIKGRSYKKLAAGAFILMLLATAGFGIWFYFGNEIMAPQQQIVEAQEKVPPVTFNENTPIPTPESADETLSVENSDIEDADNSEEPVEIIESTENASEPPITSPTYRARQIPVAKPTAQRRPIVNRNRQPNVAKPAPTQKPTKTPKKSVTLDDLIKDN